MPFLIVGHNLIGQLPDIRLDDPNDEALLVQKLSGYAARTGKRFTVIFDAGLPGGKSRMSTHTVQVIFASSPGIADKLILDRIGRTRDASNWTVVSSDHVVLDAARRRGMRAVSSSDFARELNTPAAKTVTDEDKPPPRPMSDSELDEWLRLFGRKK